MSFSEMSKQEAIRLIEAKIAGDKPSYSSIVNEAVRIIQEERNKVQRYEQSIKQIIKLVSEHNEELGLDCEKILDQQSWT